MLCCSLVQSWEIKSQRDVISPDGHNKLRKDATPEDGDNSPEIVTVERIIKSSVYPHRRDHEGKSSPVFSHVGPGNTNTTIRLKFVKSDQAGNPLDYDLTEDVKSNKHHSHTEEMSSQKIILYNQTKTQDEESKTSSKHLLQQLHNFNWPVNDENETDLKEGKVEKAVLVNLKGVMPDVIKKQTKKEEVVNQKEKGGRSKENLDEEQAILEKIREYLETRDQTTTTETPADKRYRISEPQMELLKLLYKLVQSKQITYDFINRLIYLFHTHGYQNQLLQVLFDFIIKQLQSQGNSEDQQKTLNNLMELWNVLHRLQGKPQGDLDKSKEIKPDKPSSEDPKILKLLLLLDAIKESNKNGNDVLRSNYLNELISLYNSFDNKNDLMKMIHNHLIKQQDKNKPRSGEKIPLEIPGRETKPEDINEVIQYLFKQKGLDNNKKVLVDHEKKKPSLDKIVEEKSDKSPSDEPWNALVELLSKNKKSSPKNPHDLLIMQRIIEEVEDDDRVPEKQAVDPKKRMKIKKKKKKPSRSDKKESTERMYQMLLELLQSNEIRNKEELKVQIIEMLRKIQLQKDDSDDESGQDNQSDLVAIFDLINKQKNKPEDTTACVIGTSWTIDCQSCICVAGGVPVCKRIPECVIGPKLDKPMQCKPHSKFKLDSCNTCKCNSAGIPICTLMECDEAVPRDSGSKKFMPEQEALRAILCPPERKTPVCAPRTSWRGDCYDCVCDEDGQRRCNFTKNCKFVSLRKGKVAPASQISS
ncbi:hypothetical protein O3G_MSEX009918 [Manduca sexta]|uniref:Pacifastin domain-containing protein n=2 Tax=Manduca sexta TaxID=7130 RepID=A0A921ZFL8_MANSE|nr:hypothetical protein O3G_MSEX009918 [Manduca sexta]